MAKKKVVTNGEQIGGLHQFSARLEYKFPESASPSFANQLVVQSDEHVCYLSFFYAQPPLITGIEDAQKLGENPTINAKLVSQVVIPRGRMEDFIAVIQANLNRIKERAGNQGES